MRVEVKVGEGNWQDARLVGDRKRHGWQWRELIRRVRFGWTRYGVEIEIADETIRTLDTLSRGQG